MSAKSATEGRWVELDRVVDSVVSKLNRREIIGSSTTGAQTAELLRKVVSRGNFETVQNLMEVVRSVGKLVSEGNPTELAVGNITRRVLYIIRQECVHRQKKLELGNNDQQIAVDLSKSLHNVMDMPTESVTDYLTDPDILKHVKPNIIEEIGELLEEIKTSYTSIAGQAVEHIHAKEVVLTFGVSKTVTEFFREAAKLRQFEVIVAESAPSFSGQKMATTLAEMGIETTVITDAAVFAMMPVVNKVIIGTHAVVANGGLIAHSGALNICLAAAEHSVPVVVLSGLYKLCPLYSFGPDTYNEHRAPSDALSFEETFVRDVDVVNPGFDYVEPQLVSLFITNTGGHSPGYVYRLLAEYYDPEDYTL